MCQSKWVYAQVIRIDLDRETSGVQSTYGLIPDGNGLVRGSITVEGSPSDTVGFYALEVEVRSSSRTGSLFDCNLVSTLEGRVGDGPASPGEAFCEITSEPNRFGRRSIFAEDTLIGATGSITVFLFDLPLSCDLGEVYSFDFRTTETDSQIGIRINGQARTLGSDLSSDVSFTGAVLTCQEQIDPTPTPSPTMDLSTATPTPTQTPTEGIPSISPRLEIDLDRFTPSVQSSIDWIIGDQEKIQGALMIVGQPEWSAGSYAIEVLASSGESTRTVIDCSGSSFKDGDVIDAGDRFVVEICTGQSFRRTSLFAQSAEIGSDGVVDLLHFDLDIRCEPGDRIDFSFTSSEFNPLFGVEVEGRNYTIGEDSRQPIQSEGAVLFCIAPTPTPTFTMTPTYTHTPVPTLEGEGLIEILEGIREGTHNELDLFQKSLGWMN